MSHAHKVGIRNETLAQLTSQATVYNLIFPTNVGHHKCKTFGKTILSYPRFEKIVNPNYYKSLLYPLINHSNLTFPTNVGYHTFIDF